MGNFIIVDIKIIGYVYRNIDLIYYRNINVFYYLDILCIIWYVILKQRLLLGQKNNFYYIYF